MTDRVDSASRLIRASSERLFRAFSEPGAMERWLPPRGMIGTMLRFDFREGGSYRMRLVYGGSPPGQGKTSDDSDEVEVRLTRVVWGRLIEQEVLFESEDTAFSGTMRMIWSFQEEERGTLVTVRAENVPAGIRPEDHAAGLSSSLQNLAEFAEAESAMDGASL